MAPLLSGMGQDVAHEVDTTTLPRGAKDLGDDGFDAFMGIGDDQFDDPQAPSRQFVQKVGPEGFCLLGSDGHPQYLATSGGIGTAMMTATETMRPSWRTFA